MPRGALRPTPRQSWARRRSSGVSGCGGSGECSIGRDAKPCLTPSKTLLERHLHLPLGVRNTVASGSLPTAVLVDSVQTAHVLRSVTEPLGTELSVGVSDEYEELKHSLMDSLEPEA